MHGGELGGSCDTKVKIKYNNTIQENNIRGWNKIDMVELIKYYKNIFSKCFKHRQLHNK